MTDAVKITCRLTATAPGLCLSVILDGLPVYNDDPCHGKELTIEMDDTDGAHVLEFTLSGKTPDHTKIDASGKIIEDITVSVTDIAFDQIDLGHMVVEQAVYTHDFNGTENMAQHKFYGSMGCNGTVRIEFTTPIYLWLLENM